MEGNDANGFPLEQWRLSVKTVLVPEGLNIIDEHLQYIAKRTPNLERLVLEGSCRITEKGLAEAICDWKKVEHIVFQQVKQQSAFVEVIQVIGENCSELKTLQVITPFITMTYITVDIAETLCRMKNLATLVFEGACLYREAINMIFDECLELETIHIWDCFLMDDGLQYVRDMTANIRLGVKELGSRRSWRCEASERREKPDEVLHVQKKFMQWKNGLSDFYFDIENDEFDFLDDDDWVFSP
ncbi:uncharacterized protein LOC110668955 [Hevea brasiliensis]|uniref:uncharacterized protein LOC110668955 n=1 Tax=Hevea brasiliensis TaxID=3981 RepID=UPI0025EDAF29|nr:uncharacterized protein LOC110668955 [Hevea brasiliensis]